MSDTIQRESEKFWKGDGWKPLGSRICEADDAEIEALENKPQTITIKPCCWVCGWLRHAENHPYCKLRGMDVSFDVMYCLGKDFQLKKELAG